MTLTHGLTLATRTSPNGMVKGCRFRVNPDKLFADPIDLFSLPNVAAVYRAIEQPIEHISLMAKSIDEVAETLGALAGVPVVRGQKVQPPKQVEEKQEMTLRFYYLNEFRGGFGGAGFGGGFSGVARPNPTFDFNAEMERLVDIIRNLASPGSWTKGDGAYISTYRDILVVRQKPNAQAQVARLLDKLEVPWTKSPQFFMPPVVGGTRGVPSPGGAFLIMLDKAAEP